MTFERTIDVSGTVFNVQRFSLHDGPGIRTTAFLKGCPLRCHWCHNPEGIRSEPEPMRSTNPAEEFEQVGRRITARELVKELARDRIFYEESGGGITLSGGEPLAQPAFTLEVLKQCKQLGLHTTLDTSGYAPAEIIDAVRPYTDLFLYDIKHMDSAAHEALSGCPNELILKNLETLISEGSNVAVRYPVIPGANDDDDALKQLGIYIRQLGIEQLQLLPYHAYGNHKWSKLIRMPDAQPIPRQSDERLLKVKDLLEPYGFITTIGS